MQHVAIGGSWIWLTNVRAFVVFIAGRAKYDLHPDELEAIEVGIRNSDDNQKRWYEYEIVGGSVIKLAFALSVGSNVVMWRGKCPQELVESIQVAAELMQEYRLSKGV